MKNLTNKIARYFHTPLTPEERERRDTIREWNHQLSIAISDRDRAEIDAMFARALSE